MALEHLVAEPPSLAKVKFLLKEAEMLLDGSKPLMQRLAKARVWYVFLETVMRKPKDVPDDWRKWSIEDVEKIGEALVRYAAKLFSAEEERVPIPVSGSDIS